MTVISYVKYLQYLRTTVIKNRSFFIFVKKRKGIYQLFLYHGVYLCAIFSYYMRVT